MLLSMMMGHLLAEYLAQPTPVLRWKRAARVSRSWALAALVHATFWILAIVLFSGASLEPWRYVLAFLIHGAFDCTPLGDWALEKLGLATVRSSVFVSHENELPAQVAALEFALAASQEWFSRLAFHMFLLWGMTQ